MIVKCVDCVNFEAPKISYFGKCAVAKHGEHGRRQGETERECSAFDEKDLTTNYPLIIKGNMV